MALFRKHQDQRLAIRELAVDPADVDEETYPVTIRLNRALTVHEVQALASLGADLHVEEDAVIVPGAKLDDIAHGHADWSRRLEQAEAQGAELAGEHQIAEQQRDARMRERGSNSEAGDRTGQVGMHG